MTHAYVPSYQALRAELRRERRRIADLVGLGVTMTARVGQLEHELRRLRDLVGEIDVAIIDEVLHG